MAITKKKPAKKVASKKTAAIAKKKITKVSTSKKTGARKGSSQFGPDILSSMINERAYFIWEEKGCPQGQDIEIWVQAEQEMVSKKK